MIIPQQFVTKAKMTFLLDSGFSQQICCNIYTKQSHFNYISKKHLLKNSGSMIVWMILSGKGGDVIPLNLFTSIVVGWYWYGLGVIHLSGDAGSDKAFYNAEYHQDVLWVVLILVFLVGGDGCAVEVLLYLHVEIKVFLQEASSNHEVSNNRPNLNHVNDKFEVVERLW